MQHVGIRFCLGILALLAVFTASAQLLPGKMPSTGLWYNPDRPGHGFDLHQAGDQLFMVWYTFDESGVPVWYTGQNSFTGTVWSADLLQFTWNNASNSIAGQETVGSVSLDFHDPTRAIFTWDVNGNNGSEPVEHLIFDTGFPDRDLTGQYFDASEGGWGFTVSSQGDTHVGVIYFYDEAGNATWVLGVAPDTGQTTLEFPMLQFRPGFAPYKTVIPLANMPAGTFQFTPASAAKGGAACSLASVVVDLVLSGADWMRSPCASALNEPQFSLAVDLEAPRFANQGDTVNLVAGVALDIRGDRSTISYEWNAIGTPPGALASFSAFSRNATIETGETDGTVTVQLEVSADNAETLFVQRIFSVQASVGNALAAGILVDRGEPVPSDRPVTLTATGFGGMPPYRYFWTLRNGTEFEGGASISPVPTSSEEFLVTRLRMMDNAGAEVVVDRSIDIEVATIPFFLNGPDRGEPGDTLNFSVSPGGGGYSYGWNGSGSAERILPSGSEATVMIGTGNVATVQAEVREGDSTLASLTRILNTGISDGPRLTIVSTPGALLPRQTGQIEVDVRDGTPPYTITWSSNEGSAVASTTTLQSPGATTVDVLFTEPPLGNFWEAGAVTLIDAAEETRSRQVGIRYAAGLEGLLDISVPSSAAVGDTVPIELTVRNVTYPATVALRYGDGSSIDIMRLNTGGTDVALQYEHVYDEAGTFGIVASVEDARRNMETANASIEVEDDALPAVERSVRLLNNGVDNIHICSDCRGSDFNSSNRLIPGQSRTLTITVPEGESSVDVDFSAGRMQIVRATATCTIDRETDVTVRYTETGFNSNSQLLCE